MDDAQTAFETVVRQRETQVLRIAYRMLGNWADAEDVAQESFVRLHHRGRGVLGEGEDAAGHWLCRVAMNLCLDRLRSRGRWRMSAVPDLVAAEEEFSGEVAVLRAEQKKLLAWALESLPERERAAVVLREIEGLTTAETAEAMGSTEATVRSQVSKAIGHLRAVLMRADNKERR